MLDTDRVLLLSFTPPLKPNDPDHKIISLPLSLNVGGGYWDAVAPPHAEGFRSLTHWPLPSLK